MDLIARFVGDYSQVEGIYLPSQKQLVLSDLILSY
jgi:hypothetical protein